MEMTQSTVDGACVCRLSGALDMAAADDLRSSLFPITQAGAKAVVLDLENVAFLSSPCLGALVSFQKAVAHAGGRVALCGLSPAIHKLFKIARLDQFFLISANESSAIAAASA